MSRETSPQGPHPRREPRFQEGLSLENVRAVFSDCVDFMERTVYLNGDRERTVTICYLLGMARNERLNDYILRPLSQNPALSRVSEGELFSMLQYGALYNLAALRRDSMDDVVNDLILGSCALFSPGRMDALTFPVPTEEKRGVGEPENEPALKGSRESFVESIRTNTAMIRRHLKAPQLKIKEHIVGRQSRTQVDVLYLEDMADPDTVSRVEKKLDEIDIDGLETTGNLEEYLADTARSPFPLMAYTQRPDRLCQGLLEGRVAIFADGIPLGWLVPGTIDQFFKTGQDRAYHWMVASALSLVRYFCALITLLLPGLYIALVTFHPEAIPPKLALSIVAAKQEVPFSTIFEVLIMLLAFEVIQEAGLRLPGPSGPLSPFWAAWWWATPRWRPTSCRPRYSSPWPSPGWRGTPSPPRTLATPCGCGGFCWPSWPVWAGCSAWPWAGPPSSITWPGWRALASPIWPPLPLGLGPGEATLP